MHLLTLTRKISAFSGYNPSGRSSGNGHLRHVGPVRQDLPDAGQEEEVRNKSSPEDLESCFQRDLRIQGNLMRGNIMSSMLPNVVFRIKQ